MKETLNLPCPICAEFALIEDKSVSCLSCDYRARKLPLKTAYEYASFVFQYGHQYKTYYETQLKEHGSFEVKGNLEPPHPLHVVISLPLLSGIIGTTSWFLVKTAISTMVDSYNKKYDTDYTMPEDDIRTLNKNFREFVNNFVDVDEKIRNAVFEEMFAAECSQKEKSKLIALRQKAEKLEGDQQQQIHNKADKMLNDLMKKTFKKIGNRPKPTPEELSSFWLGVIQ